MRIGFFADTYYPQLNGVATSVAYSVAMLRKFDHKVIVIAPQIKGYKDSEKDILRIPSSKIWPSIPDSARLPLPIPSSVWKKIMSHDYQIIHAHGNGLFSLIGLIIARRKKLPFVLTFHTFFNQYAHYFLGGKLITPTMIDWGLKSFGNLCDEVIVPSQKMKQELIKIGIKKPISVIPNFVDISKFVPGKSNFLHSTFSIPQKRQILLSVGRLGQEKNFEFLINVFARIVKNNKDVHLVIVGEGPDRNKLIEQIKKLDLLQQVTLTGPIEIEDMPKVYQSANIFVFASTTETQGMVTLEAAASGLPLVLAHDEAYQDIIENKVNGFSLPLKEGAFVEKIELLLHNPDMQKAFGVLSIKIVRLLNNEKRLTDKMINLYKKIVLFHSKNCLKNYQ